MIGHTLRHVNELENKIIEGKIEGKMDRGRPRTSLVEQMISDARLLTCTELKRLAGNGEEWRMRIRPQNRL